MFQSQHRAEEISGSLPSRQTHWAGQHPYVWQPGPTTSLRIVWRPMVSWVKYREQGELKKGMDINGSRTLKEKGDWMLKLYVEFLNISYHLSVTCQNARQPDCKWISRAVERDHLIWGWGRSKSFEIEWERLVPTKTREGLQETELCKVGTYVVLIHYTLRLTRK